MPDADPAILDAESFLLDVEPTILDAESFLLDANPAILDAEYFLPDADPTILDAECFLPDADPAILDAEYFLPDTDPTILDAESFLPNADPAILDAECFLSGRPPAIRTRLSRQQESPKQLDRSTNLDLHSNPTIPRRQAPRREIEQIGSTTSPPELAPPNRAKRSFLEVQGSPLNAPPESRDQWLEIEVR